MKKVFLFSFAATVVTIMGVLNTGLAQRDISSNVSLDTVEALSACEVSENASENNGYCVTKYNSTEKVCVEEGSGTDCCSGTY